MENVINAPLPGTVMEVLVEVNQKVNMNDPILILEAMKMQNEILADCEGTISKVLVSVGDTVNAGTPMVEII